jgi:hypothetical protein
MFAHGVEDIRFMKRNQWMVTNYGVAIHAGLVGLVKLAGPDNGQLSPAERVVFASLAGLAALAGIYLLSRFQKSMAKYRRRLDELCRVCTECPESPKEVDVRPSDSTYLSFWKDGSIFVLLCFVLVFGACAVCWVVYR